jgi:hypothetical protein
MTTRLPPAALALTGLLALGCGSTSPAQPADDAGVLSVDAQPGDAASPPTPPLRGACPLAERLGGFVVESQEDFAFVDGKASDRVNPNTVPDEVLTLRGCRLLRRRILSCEPPCAPGETCGDRSQCVPYPLQRDLGIVTVTGLVREVVLEPRAPGNNYFDTDLPTPPYRVGQAIGLRSTAGALGALELRGWGVEPLQLGAPARLTLERGRDLQVSWPPPREALTEDTRVELRINIDQHGASPTNLVCELPDTGSATISATLVDALLNLGVSGFPNAALARRTADAARVPGGCVELEVRSPQAIEVRVGGHVPCTTQAQCPPELRCDLPTNTCR